MSQASKISEMRPNRRVIEFPGSKSTDSISAESEESKKRTVELYESLEKVWCSLRPAHESRSGWIEKNETLVRMRSVYEFFKNGG
jgi:hypothetical protein